MGCKDLRILCCVGLVGSVGLGCALLLICLDDVFLFFFLCVFLQLQVGLLGCFGDVLGVAG